MLYRCAREMSLMTNRTRKERRRPECLGGHEADDVFDANRPTDSTNAARERRRLRTPGRTAGEWP